MYCDKITEMNKCFLPYSCTYSSQREYNKYAAILDRGHGETVYLEMTGAPAWAVACCETPEEKGVWYFDDARAVRICEAYRRVRYSSLEAYELSDQELLALDDWYSITDCSEEVMTEIRAEMRQTLEYLQYMLNEGVV